jgi:hypothetical protein
MKPPALDRLRKEDIKDSPDWFGVVITFWNRFVEALVTILTKNITFEDNIASQIYSDKIDQTKIDQGYKISVTMKSRPQGVLIMKIVKEGGSHTAFTTAPFVDWLYEEGFIKINAITAIDATSVYSVQLLII